VRASQSLTARPRHPTPVDVARGCHTATVVVKISRLQRPASRVPGWPADTAPSPPL